MNGSNPNSVPSQRWQRGSGSRQAAPPHVRLRPRSHRRGAAGAWAKVKGRRKAAVAKPAKKRKRRVSAATRARLAAIAKARWAKVKAAGQATL